MFRSDIRLSTSSRAMTSPFFRAFMAKYSLVSLYCVSSTYYKASITKSLLSMIIEKHQVLCAFKITIFCETKQTCKLNLAFLLPWQTLKKLVQHSGIKIKHVLLAPECTPCPQKSAPELKIFKIKPALCNYNLKAWISVLFSTKLPILVKISATVIEILTLDIQCSKVYHFH